MKYSTLKQFQQFWLTWLTSCKISKYSGYDDPSGEVFTLFCNCTLFYLLHILWSSVKEFWKMCIWFPGGHSFEQCFLHNCLASAVELCYMPSANFLPLSVCLAVELPSRTLSHKPNALMVYSTEHSWSLIATTSPLTNKIPQLFLPLVKYCSEKENGH